MIIPTAERRWWGRRVAGPVSAVLILGMVLYNVVPPLLGQIVPPPYSYQRLPISVLTPKVKAGGAITNRTSLCVAEPNISVTFSWGFVSDDWPYGRYPTGTFTRPFDKAECTTTDSNLVVPTVIQPGRYHVEGTTEARGRWRTVTIPWSTESFEVMP